MQRDREGNYYSLSPLHLRPPLGRDRLSLTLVHSPLVALEAVVVGAHGRCVLAVINHRAAVKGGLIHNKHTHHYNSHHSNRVHHSGHHNNNGNNGNHHSDSNSSNSITANNDCRTTITTQTWDGGTV